MRPIDRWVSRLHLVNATVYTCAAVLCAALSFQPYCDNQVQLTFARTNTTKILHSSKFHTGLGFVIVLALSAVTSFVLSRFSDEDLKRTVFFVQCEQVLTIPLMHACIAMGVAGSTDVWALLSIMAAALLIVVNLYTEWQVSVQSIVHALLIMTIYVMLLVSATDSGRARLLYLAIVAAIVLLLSALAVSGHPKLKTRHTLRSIIVRTTSALMIKVFITIAWAATCVDLLEVRAMVGTSMAFIVMAYVSHTIILWSVPNVETLEAVPTVLGHDNDSPYNSGSIAAIDEGETPYNVCPTEASPNASETENEEGDETLRKQLL